MVIQTLSPQLTLPRLDEPDARRHGTKIEVVRVLAVVPYLAKVPEIVLADGHLLLAFAWVDREGRMGFEIGWRGGGVPEWTQKRGKGATRGEEGEAAYLIIYPNQISHSTGKRAHLHRA